MLKSSLISSVILALLVGSAPASPVQRVQGDQRLAQIHKLVDRGEFDTAEKQIWDIVTQEPENAPALSVLGTIRMRQKRLPEAEALFKRTLAINGNLPEAHRSLGEIYSLTDRPAEAKAAYARAHELKPRDPKISLELAEAYQKSGDFQLSVETINSIPPASRPSAYLPILASDYFGLKQPEKVAALAPLVRQHAASDATLLTHFARVLANNGYVDDAAELLKNATPRMRETVDYLLVMARIQEQQGNPGSAQQTLSQALKVYPDSYEVLLQSARLASQAKNHKMEVKFLRDALAVKPDDIEALRHLVLARIRANDAILAISDARRLYELQPDQPDSVYLLGAALINHSDWHDARPPQR